MPSAANSTSFRGRSRPWSRWVRTSSRAAAKTGKRAASSRPMPGRWEPCPAKRKASLDRVLAVSCTRPGAGAPSASAVRAARARSRSAAVNAARCSRPARAVASEWATSTGARRGWDARWSSSRAAWARNASRVRPETSHGRAPAAPVPEAGVSVPSWPPSGAGAAGASSRIVCALVPLSPNEETPARRGRSPWGQGACSVSRRTAPCVQSTCEDGASTWRVRGSRPCRMASTILMTPAMPAAAWVWPRLDLTEPSSSGRSASRPCP